jgi:NADPH:quinone reductase-like Zn-dependent oxidoreductase
MRGVIVKDIGATATVVVDLEIPELAEDQVLVKSIYTAINPVYVLALEISAPPVLTY